MKTNYDNGDSGDLENGCCSCTTDRSFRTRSGGGSPGLDEYRRTYLWGAGRFNTAGLPPHAGARRLTRANHIQQ